MEIEFSWDPGKAAKIRFDSSMLARPRAANVMTTKKAASRKPKASSVDHDTLGAEYDFSAGVRGKYAGRYPHGCVVVTLDPDVAAVYPSAAAANAASRRLIRGAKRPPRRSKRRA